MKTKITEFGQKSPLVFPERYMCHGWVSFQCLLKVIPPNTAFAPLLVHNLCCFITWVSDSLPFTFPPSLTKQNKTEGIQWDKHLKGRSAKRMNTSSHTQPLLPFSKRMGCCLFILLYQMMRPLNWLVSEHGLFKFFLLLCVGC